MDFCSRAPRAPLDDYIETFWHYEGYTSPHRMERILPTGTFELVFNLRGNELRIYDKDNAPRACFSGALVAGPYGSFFVTDAAEEACVMGAHFKPGGAFLFLAPTAGELADAHFDLEHIWGSRAEELRERLAEAVSSAERFSLLEEALLGRLALDRKRHPQCPRRSTRFQGA